MGLKEIVSTLESIFETKKSRATKQTGAIEELVEQLVSKEAKYRTKLAVAQNDRDKEKLTRKIKVCKAQIAKGRALLDEFQKTSA